MQGPGGKWQYEFAWSSVFGNNTRAISRYRGTPGKTNGCHDVYGKDGTLSIKQHIDRSLFQETVARLFSVHNDAEHLATWIEYQVEKITELDQVSLYKQETLSVIFVTMNTQCVVA